MVLYTDGLVERRTEVIDDGLERLRSTAEGFDGSLEELCDHLMTELAPLPGAARDDVAIIALERAEPEPALGVASVAWRPARRSPMGRA